MADPHVPPCNVTACYCVVEVIFANNGVMIFVKYYQSFSQMNGRYGGGGGMRSRSPPRGGRGGFMGGGMMGGGGYGGGGAGFGGFGGPPQMRKVSFLYR